MNSEKENLVQAIREIADQLEWIDEDKTPHGDMAILKEKTVDLLIEVSRSFSNQQYASRFKQIQRLLESIRGGLQER